MGLLNDCPICYQQDISQCVDTLVFALDLTPDATYIFTFTDNHNKEHVITAVANLNGTVTIDVADLPDGFFIVYSGVKTVTFKEQGGCDNLCFTPCSGGYYSTTEADTTEYCCITLRPVDRNDESSADEIIEIIPCCAGEATETIVLEASFACTEGVDEGVVSGDFTVTNGSGNYGAQLFRDGLWVTVVEGIDSPLEYTVPEPTAAHVMARIIDLDTLAVSNEVEITITSCAEQVLELDDVDFNCVGINGVLSVAYTVTNHSGTGISVQYYDGVTWNEIAVISAPIADGSYAQDISFNPPTGSYPIRLVSGASISNIIVQGIVHCGATETIILNSVGNFQCQTEQGLNIANVDVEVTNQVGSLFLQVFISGVWTSLFQVFSGQSDYNLPASASGGLKDFRVIDTTSMVVSNTFSVTVPTCLQSTLTLHQVGNQGSTGAGTTISIDYSALNIFELINGAKDLIIQYSADGVTNWISNQPFAIPSSPFTGHPAVFTMTSPQYAPLVFVRIYGNDQNGNPIFSNALPIPP